MRICADSSVLVPLVLDYHSQHALVVEQFASVQRQRHELVIAAHSLAETYSTVTRLPRELRAAPEVAAAAIEALVGIYDARLAALAPHEYMDLLRTAPARGIRGGRTYDALIARTAVQAGADAILTFNARDFAGLEPTLQVVVPGQ